MRKILKIMTLSLARSDKQCLALKISPLYKYLPETEKY
jgi:hypothetical protein